MRRTKLEKWICQKEAVPELTRENLEALQLKRLNEMLARMHDRGGIYRNYPRSVESLEQLRELPFITAEMLADKPGQFLLTSQAEVSRVISGATSGTTGPAKRVFYTGNDTDNTVGFFAAGISEMLSPGERCFIAFPFSGSFGLGDLIAQAVEQLGGIAVKAGFGHTWQDLLELLEQTQPETYIGFPVTLLSLARMYGKNFPVKRALVSADACPDGVLEALEGFLGSKLYPHYGSRECGLGGAVTCPAFEGMHIRENHIIPEIIDAQGNVLSEGEYGELVITTIGLEAMPLIRYRTGDYTRILPPCSCGGVTRRIDKVSRREGPLSIELLDSSLFLIPGLIDCQVGYDGKLVIEARCLSGNWDNEIFEAAKTVYPDLEIAVYTEKACMNHRPMYPGKRHIILR